jgi:hypothetical protein
VKKIQILFKIFSVGSICLLVGLGCAYLYFEIRPNHGFNELGIWVEILFGLALLSFISIIFCIWLSILFLIRKSGIPRLELALFLAGMISWVWIVLIDTNGYFYLILD